MNTINYKNKLVVDSSVIITLYYFMYFLKMIFSYSPTASLILSAILSFIGCGSLLVCIIGKNTYVKKAILLFSIMYIFAIISSLYTKNYETKDYLLPFQYIGISLLLIKYKLNYKVIRANYFFCAGFFFINALLGISPDNLFEGFSRNIVSSLMILFSVLLYLSLYQNNRKINLYPAAITLIISFWGIGRSGIIVSAILLIGIFLITYKKSSNKIIYPLIIGFLSYIIYNILTSAFFYDMFVSNTMQRVARLGLDDPNRTLIIKEYYYLIQNFYNLIFGAPIINNPIFQSFGLNLHNSYLNLHAFYGLGGFLVFLIYVLISLIKILKDKNYLILLLFIVILSRMATDRLAFNGPFDSVIYLFFFVEVLFKKSSLLSTNIESQID